MPESVANIKSAHLSKSKLQAHAAFLIKRERNSKDRKNHRVNKMYRKFAMKKQSEDGEPEYY